MAVLDIDRMSDFNALRGSGEGDRLVKEAAAAYAAELALTTVSPSSRTTAEERSTDRTVSTPGGSDAAAVSGRSAVRLGRASSRSLQRNASTAITPVTRPTIALAAATAAFTSTTPG